MEKVLNEEGKPVMEPERQQVAVKNGNTAVAFAPQHLGAIAGAAQQILTTLMTEVAKGNLPIETAGFLKKMYEEERLYEAEMAFNEAMSLAKAEMPLIKKTKHVGFKSKKQGAADTSYTHEDLADVTKITDPILGKYGLVSTFRVVNANQLISVTCVVKHRMGFRDESNTLVAGRDDSGNKNAIQQVSSTITYLKRYTLMAALGLAAEDDDDDGRSSDSFPLGSSTLTPSQVEGIKQAFKDHGGDVGIFLQNEGYASIEDIETTRYDHFCQKIKDVAERRKKREADNRAQQEARLRQEKEDSADVEKIKADVLKSSPPSRGSTVA